MLATHHKPIAHTSQPQAAAYSNEEAETV